MISTNDLKNGITIEYEGNIYVVMETQHVKPGKGAQLMQYLYNMNDTYYFMNMTTYEQLELSEAQVGESKKFLKENLEVYITSFEGEILGIDLPDKVELEITHTEPAVKGNTTTNALKDAECETGLVVRVPLFVEQGEKILVSTSDGKYVSRA